MKQFFSSSFYNDLEFFFKHYTHSVQGTMQIHKTDNPKEVFEQAVYCFLTPATKSDAADRTYQDLFHGDFFYQATLPELAECLKKPPYIRFHNQKAERLFLWRKEGENHVKTILSLSKAKEQRQYLVDHIKGMNYKESTHFLRNIGRSENLVILDRHIIHFMQTVQILSPKEDMSKLSKKYLLWEQQFVDFVMGELWGKHLGACTIAQADFAIWAASVKRADPKISYERVLLLR